MKHLSLSKEQVDLLIHLCNSEFNSLELLSSNAHCPRSIMSLIEQKKLELNSLVTDILSQNGN